MEVWKEMYLSLVRDTEKTINLLFETQRYFEELYESSSQKPAPFFAEWSLLYLSAMGALEKSAVLLIAAQQECENMYLEAGEKSAVIHQFPVRTADTD